MLKRREFIQAMGAGGLAISLPLQLFAQSLTTASLGSGISLISGAGCNVVVAVGSESVIVVDGGLQQNAPALIREINALAQGKPIAALFNTNWRPEHTGLNHLLRDTNIIAHENTRLWQTADVYVEWEDKRYLPMPEEAQANKTFYKKGSLRLGEETIEYGYLPQAHTDGDIYVHFTRANVMVVSDLLGVNAYPILDYVTGGWIGGMQNSTAALLEMTNDATRIIAAEGVVQSKMDLQKQSEMLDQARELIGDSFRSGWSLEDFKASNPAADFAGNYGDPDLFLTQLYRGTWYRVPGRALRNVI